MPRVVIPFFSYWNSSSNNYDLRIALELFAQSRAVSTALYSGYILAHLSINKATVSLSVGLVTAGDTAFDSGAIPQPAK